MARLRSLKQGFSLADVVVAIGIFVIIALMLGSFVYVQMLRRLAQYEAYATRVATDKLEELKSTAWDTLPSNGAITHDTLLELPGGSGSFTVGALSGSVRQVEITISWTYRGRSKEYKQTTYLSEGGL